MSEKLKYNILRSEDEANKCAKAVYQYLSLEEKTFHSEENLKKLFLNQNTITLYAEVSGKVVGLINGIVLPSPTIRLLVVLDEEEAKMGLGGKLIDQFVDIIKERYPLTKNVTTMISNEQNDAIALYLSKGFTISGFIHEENKGIVLLKKRIR
ncbi:MAG: GNAT family N-acetyltransferase [Nitrososphaeria archaeon]